MSVDVAFYLNHLLYRNNVAILPGFGAFVSTPTNSVIDHARGTFTPPSKILTFNENLKINDGFLINLIRHKHGYTAHEARAIVENFVQSINDILKNKDSVRLDKIGKLFLNHNNQIIFEPEQKSNFNVASFGLPSVQYYPLPKINQEGTSVKKEEIKPNVENVVAPSENNAINQPEPIVREIKPSWLERNRFASAAVLFGLLATTAIWYFNNNHNEENEQSHLSIPVSEIRVNVKPGAENEAVAQNENNQSTDNQSSIVDDKPIDEQTQSQKSGNESIKNETYKPKQENEINNAPTIPDRIYGANTTIYIIGTYSKQGNIRRTSRLIKQRGFELYNVAYNGMRRVGAVIKFNSEIDKNNQISRLRAEFGDGIWELEK